MGLVDSCSFVVLLRIACYVLWLLFVGDCWLLFVVCCLLFVDLSFLVCCLLFIIVHGSLFVVGGFLFVVCLFDVVCLCVVIVRCLLCFGVDCYMSFVVCLLIV